MTDFPGPEKRETRGTRPLALNSKVGFPLIRKPRMSGAPSFRGTRTNPHVRLPGRTKKRTLTHMNTMNASEAREKLYRLLDETAAAHEPVLITGPRSNGVLLGEEDWNAIQETLHLLSVPGMRESIREGLATPVDECEKEPGW